MPEKNHETMVLCARLVVCLNNENYEASLEVGKLYRLVPDDETAVHAHSRLIDESGAEYAYAADRFLALDLSLQQETALCAGRPQRAT